MNITLKKEDVVEGVQKAYSIIPSKAGAYLRSLWLHAEENTVSIMATDASIEFKGVYCATVQEKALVGVSSRSFVELLRKLSPGEITLSLDAENGTLLIIQDKSKFNLPISDPVWFQPFSLFPEENSIQWNGHILLDIIEKIAFCISDDETIEGINCISIKPSGTAIEICGLNGHQLAILKIENESLAGILPPKGILIHKKYLQELKKLVSMGELVVSIHENRFYIRTEDHTEQIAFPLHSHQYPEYMHFLERLQGKEVSKLCVNRKKMQEALDKILIFNTESNRCVYFTLTPTELTLSVQGYEVGNGIIAIESTFTGSISTIAFPTKNVMEILSKYTSEDITFMFTSTEGPCGIIGENDAEYTVIIMPMKITDSQYYEGK